MDCPAVSVLSPQFSVWKCLFIVGQKISEMSFASARKEYDQKLPLISKFTPEM